MPKIRSKLSFSNTFLKHRVRTSFLNCHFVNLNWNAADI